MSSASRKNFGASAPQAPRAAFKPRDAKTALASKPNLDISLPSFGNPFAGLGAAGTPAAAAPKAAESSGESGEGVGLLPVLLLLFSPLAIVQALSFQVRRRPARPLAALLRPLALYLASATHAPSLADRRAPRHAGHLRHQRHQEVSAPPRVSSIRLPRARVH